MGSTSDRRRSRVRLLARAIPDEDRANAEALLASAKNREEHAIVVEAIEDVLGMYCEHLDHDPEPVLVETANVWHLATRFRGTLRIPSPGVVELVAALHPTPAVGGTPTATAKAAIDELEPFDRGGYAGAVGWMDAEGDGEWAIALRCARLDGQRATLYAGAGIVADSQPADELDETDRKFRAVPRFAALGLIAAAQASEAATFSLSAARSVRPSAASTTTSTT